MLNKGFLMIDLLIVVFIMGLITTLSLNMNFHKDFKDKMLLATTTSDLTDTKLNSIRLLEEHCLNDNSINSHHPICYNKKGNINMAQTIGITGGNQKIVLHLGSGIYEIK